MNKRCLALALVLLTTPALAEHPNVMGVADVPPCSAATKSRIYAVDDASATGVCDAEVGTGSGGGSTFSAHCKCVEDPVGVFVFLPLGGGGGGDVDELTASGTVVASVTSSTDNLFSLHSKLVTQSGEVLEIKNKDDVVVWTLVPTDDGLDMYGNNETPKFRFSGSQIHYSSGANADYQVIMDGGGIHSAVGLTGYYIWAPVGYGQPIYANSISKTSGLGFPSSTTSGLYSDAKTLVLVAQAETGAVNYWAMKPSLTGFGPSFRAEGTDTDITAFFSGQGLGGTSIEGCVKHGPRTTAPSGANECDEFYHTVNKSFCGYDGTSWLSLAGGSC